MNPRLSLYPVSVVSVHDGDTFHVDVPFEVLMPGSLGFQPIVRLAGVNAAELATADGKAALASVKDWLAVETSYTLLVYGREKYGRLLADLTSPTGRGTLSAYVATLPGTKPLPLMFQLGQGGFRDPGVNEPTL